MFPINFPEYYSFLGDQFYEAPGGLFAERDADMDDCLIIYENG